MTALDLYGLGALGLTGLVFCFVRRISVYLALGTAVVVGLSVATSASSDLFLTRVVMTAGVAACLFGLLIVRVMLIRSVSLQLLDRIDGARLDVFDDDIRRRLNDMRAFYLVRPTADRQALTAFGQLVGGFVAACYWLFRIRA
jgi:hypothetical protein